MNNLIHNPYVNNPYVIGAGIILFLVALYYYWRTAPHELLPYEKEKQRTPRNRPPAADLAEGESGSFAPAGGRPIRGAPGAAKALNETGD